MPPIQVSDNNCHPWKHLFNLSLTCFVPANAISSHSLCPGIRPDLPQHWLDLFVAVPMLSRLLLEDASTNITDLLVALNVKEGVSLILPNLEVLGL